MLIEALAKCLTLIEIVTDALQMNSPEDKLLISLKPESGQGSVGIRSTLKL